MIGLLISLILVSTTLALFPPKEYQARIVVYTLLGVILAAAAAFRPGYSDYEAYILGYQSINETGITIAYEPTFIWISQSVNQLFGNVLFLFVIYAIIGVWLKLIAIRELSQFWFLSLVIYIGYFYILHEMIQMRAGVATGFLLLCIKPIYERNWKLFLFFSVCAILFHYSAILILPLWFLGQNPRRTALALAIPAAYLIYISGINLISVTMPIPILQQKLELYQTLQEQGVEWATTINVFNPVLLVRITIFYLLLWKLDIITNQNRYALLLMKIYCISLIAFPAFSAMPVLASRVNEFFGVVEIILFPMLVYVSHPTMISKTLVVIIGLALFSISVFDNHLIY